MKFEGRSKEAAVLPHSKDAWTDVRFTEAS